MEINCYNGKCLYNIRALDKCGFDGEEFIVTDEGKCLFVTKKKSKVL